MKKLIVAGLILLQACSSSGNYVLDQFEKAAPGHAFAVAHRGCWFKEADGEFYIPENSTYGIEMAARYGYAAVEMDVKYTLDRKMVVMHDRSINRTMRNAADYSKIDSPVYVDAMLFEDLRRDYVLESSDPAMRTPIPTLEEMLRCCKKTGIVPMLHSNVLESYSLARKILGERWIAFDSNYSAMKVARGKSGCLVLWDPGKKTAEETVAGLQALGGWCGMSTMRYEMLDSAYISKVQEAGFLAQSSIFPTPHDQDAIRDGADIVLSDFYWYQTGTREPFESMSADVAPGKTWHSPSMLDVGDFSAVTIEASIAGPAVIKVYEQDSIRTYALSGDGSPVHMGFRFYKTVPRVELSVPEDGVHSSIKVDYYRL